MALNNVKVTGISKGDVTEIQYDGKTFEKVTGVKPMEGDIGLRVKHGLIDIAEVGRYYEIAKKRTTSGEVAYYDEDGMYVTSEDADNFVYFRDKAKTAVVKPEPNQATEKRPAKVGEKIVITDAEPRLDQSYEKGDVLTVREVNVMARGDVRVEGEEVFVDYSEYEVLVETPTEGFEVGDIVKVIDKDHVSFGAILRIIDTEYDEIYPYDTEHLNGRIGDCFAFDDLDTAVNADKPESAQVGDRIVVTEDLEGKTFDTGDKSVGWGRIGQGLAKSGTTGEVVSTSSTGVEIEFDKVPESVDSYHGDPFFVRHGEYVIESKAEQAPKQTPKVGDTVMVTTTVNEFRKGDILKLIATESFSFDFKVKKIDCTLAINGQTGYIDAKHVEVTRPVETKTDEGGRDRNGLAHGDIVKAEVKSGQVVIGEIVRGPIGPAQGGNYTINNGREKVETLGNYVKPITKVEDRMN